MSDVAAEARQLFGYSQTIRRDLHRNPELGFKEFRTAGVIARELGQLGLEVHTGVGQTGVVALLEGEKPGPTALLRFDMDALPIEEQTGAEYSSQVPGVMHACGHDGHVATGLTVAHILNDQKDHLRGAVKFLFQPAEEGMGGAESVLKAGVLANPDVDFCLALHLWNERPVGWLGITPGPLMAGSEIFQVIIEGKGGHGAIPHQTADPVAASAAIISALQTIVSRNVAPLQSAVVSVTKIRAGEVHNVIPQTAELAGTIRSFEPEVREVVLRRFEEIVKGIASTMGCQAQVKVQRLTPTVINDETVTQKVREAAQRVLPEAKIDANCRTMASEDMAYVMEQVPGCYFLIGSASPEKGAGYPHHHPKFDIDERALPLAAALMSEAAMALLE
jgi:amidohydrolase